MAWQLGRIRFWTPAPHVIPAEAGIQEGHGNDEPGGEAGKTAVSAPIITEMQTWIPAFAGMTRVTGMTRGARE